MKEIAIYSKELIGTVKLHTPTMLYLECKILGTQNWPKTAQKSQFWDILSHSKKKIAIDSKEWIGTVKLHTPIMF